MIKNDVAVLKTDMEIVKDDQNILEHSMKALKSDVSAAKITLENEIDKGIKVIAEGHLDLSRKLNTVLKFEEEKELLLLRMNWLESELEKVKARLKEIA